MANESIYAAFERMWQHIVAKLGNLVSYTDSQTLSDDQKIMATTNIGAKPEDVIATISGTYVPGTGVTQFCDKSFEDLWTANEEGRDIIFNISGYQNVKGEFHNINTENGKVRQIHIRVFTTTGYSSYVINEDNTITFTQANLLNSRMIATTTGTNASLIMSQKAVTEALSTKPTTPDIAEVNQVLSVKEIDENGKPVEWECVNLPDSGESVDIQPLTFTGAVNATYDGSEAVTVEIPSGGDGGEGTTKTIMEETLTEAVKEFVYTFSAEDISKINSAKKVRFLFDAFNDIDPITGVTFGIHRPSWYGYAERFFNNVTFQGGNNSHQIGFATYTYDFQDALGKKEISQMVTGVSSNMSVSPTYSPKGLMENGDSLKLSTSLEDGFPVGTIIKVEVIA